MKKRKEYCNTLTHCYQRTVDGMVIFYTDIDYLLYYTIFCVTAPKYRLNTIKLSLMPDHIHLAAVEYRVGEISRFIQDCHSRFARQYNKVCNRKGPLFEHHYGSALKYEQKKARSVLVYLDNNQVERRLAVKAEDSRWNFLAYGNSDHPFSEEIILRKASFFLRRALGQISALQKTGRPPTYAMLRRLYNSLSDKGEREQLTDYIITTYSVIDHQRSIQYFGSYEAELTAAHATSGSEYDLKEIFEEKSDACYARMTELLRQEGRYKKDIHEIFFLPPEEKEGLFQLLRQKTPFPSRQIAKFLQLSVIVKR